MNIREKLSIFSLAVIQPFLPGNLSCCEREFGRQNQKVQFDTMMVWAQSRFGTECNCYFGFEIKSPDKKEPFLKSAILLK